MFHIVVGKQSRPAHGLRGRPRRGYSLARGFTPPRASPADSPPAPTPRPRGPSARQGPADARRGTERPAPTPAEGTHGRQPPTHPLKKTHITHLSSTGAQRARRPRPLKKNTDFVGGSLPRRLHIYGHSPSPRRRNPRPFHCNRPRRLEPTNLQAPKPFVGQSLPRRLQYIGHAPAPTESHPGFCHGLPLMKIFHKYLTVNIL